MQDRPASGQSVTWKKNLSLEPVWYRTKPMQFGVFDPVQDWNVGCLSADAGYSFLDVDDQQL